MTAEMFASAATGTGGNVGHDAGIDQREYAARVGVLCARLRQLGIGALALASPENIYYLTGLDHLGYFAFTMLVVSADGELTLVTREMERPTVRAQVPSCRHLTYGDGTDPATAVASALVPAYEAGELVGVERHSMFLPPSILDEVASLLPDLRAVDASGLLTAQRAVKSPTEIGLTRRAARLSGAGMRAAIDSAVPGATEPRIAADVLHAMVDGGGQLPGFPPLIRPTSMLDREHVTWSDRVVTAGQPIFVELSGCAGRYHAPMSRTIYPGPPTSEAGQAAGLAMAGRSAALDALQPGNRAGEVYQAWQRAVAGDGSGRPLRHHCGYLVGIGFPPSWVGGPEVLGLRAGSDVELAVGMAFHLMSWVSEPAGHVISDTVLITQDGPEVLTDAPHQLIVTA